MRSEPRKLRVVVDTNVLFSALALPKESPPLHVLEFGRSGKILIFSSPFILDELERNLLKKAGWEDEAISSLRRRLRLFLELVDPPRRLSIISSHTADNRVLECAVEAKADVIVTGDIKHIRSLGSFEGIAILTPREFMDKYFPSA